MGGEREGEDGGPEPSCGEVRRKEDGLSLFVYADGALEGCCKVGSSFCCSDCLVLAYWGDYVTDSCRVPVSFLPFLVALLLPLPTLTLSPNGQTISSQSASVTTDPLVGEGGITCAVITKRYRRTKRKDWESRVIEHTVARGGLSPIRTLTDSQKVPRLRKALHFFQPPRPLPPSAPRSSPSPLLLPSLLSPSASAVSVTPQKQQHGHRNVRFRRQALYGRPLPRRPESSFRPDASPP